MDRLVKALVVVLVLILSVPLLLGGLFVLMMLMGTGAVASPTCSPTASGGWRIPFAQAYQVTSEFGPRKHPVTGEWKLHSGIDLAATAKPGRVVAAGPGTVTSAGVLGGYGNAVTVDHGGGVSTLYGHQASIDPAAPDR